jgi:hypothetical protein
VKPEDLLPTATKNEITDSGETKQRVSEKQSAGFRPYNNAPASAASPNALGASGSASLPTEQKTTVSGISSPGLSGRGEGIKDTPKGLAGAAVSYRQTSRSAEERSSYTQTAQPPVQVFTQTRPEQNELTRIAQARIKGYEGDPCPSCGSLTLVRNGTCMKCQTCGGTTGCS